MGAVNASAPEASAAPEQSALETAPTASANKPAAVDPLVTAPTRPEIEKPKAISATVRAILDQISKVKQSRKLESDTEMDQLRSMAQKVNDDLHNEEMIQRIGEAMEATEAGAYSEPAATNQQASSSNVYAPSNRSASLSNNAAFASQMQAYRENA
ncbi:hypothetical protein [Aureimonas sp. Leaf324]|uniref:hypothetical protein n=1 Tax=Aureimonas sp. Leaf324 TaxID=1736336 RepID=UPI000AA75797|nr:hypothetical protein [Aureimonas sp. Leaf324]